MKEDKKQFYVIATPIGNLEDITFRAIRILSEVDVVLCEDTRVTGKLLKHYNISAQLESYHGQSSEAKEQTILDNIGNGVRYALVSDAGTPTISDPGVKLIHRAYERFGDNFEVISVPGPTALITALSSSGFTGNQFTFYGFLPHKKGRATLFEEMFQSPRISVFYESPHRLMKTLKFLFEHYADSQRTLFVARELTKMYEEKIRGSISEVYLFFKNNPEKIKGEFVVIIDKE